MSPSSSSKNHQKEENQRPRRIDRTLLQAWAPTILTIVSISILTIAFSITIVGVQNNYGSNYSSLISTIGSQFSIINNQSSIINNDQKVINNIQSADQNAINAVIGPKISAQDFVLNDSSIALYNGVKQSFTILNVTGYKTLYISNPESQGDQTYIFFGNSPNGNFTTAVGCTASSSSTTISSCILTQNSMIESPVEGNFLALTPLGSGDH